MWKGFPQPYEDYSLIYKYSLKDIYENWREMKNLLFLCGGVFSLLLSLCLIALLNRLFHPVYINRFFYHETACLYFLRSFLRFPAYRKHPNPAIKPYNKRSAGFAPSPIS